MPAQQQQDAPASRAEGETHTAQSRDTAEGLATPRVHDRESGGGSHGGTTQTLSLCPASAAVEM